MKRSLKLALLFDNKEYELHHSEDKVKWFFRRCLALSAKWSNRILIYGLVICVAFMPSTRQGISEIIGFLGAYVAGNFTIQALYMGAATWADMKEIKQQSLNSKGES
jgi:hypothetical protein